MRPTSTRRRTAYAGAAALVVTGLVPLVASAAGSPCPTYVDPAKDAAPVNGALNPLAGDDSLDMLSITHSAANGVLSSTVQVAALQEGGSKYSAGDWFEMNFTVREKAVAMRVIRDTDVEKTTETRITVAGVVQEFAPEAVYDFPSSTVTLKVKQADLEKALGGSLKGQKFTAMTARSLANYVLPGITWDLAAAPEGATYTFGDVCKSPAGGKAPAPSKAPAASPSAGASPSAKPSASPTASPTPSGSPSGTAAPSASPTGSPAPPQPTVPVPGAGCLGFADAKGDAKPSAGPASPGNDPDLDIVGVTGRTTKTLVAAHLQIDKLAGKPSFPAFSGHRFEHSFAVGGKVVLLRADAEGPGVGLVDGDAAPDLKVTAAFDTVSSQVVLGVDRASLAKAIGSAVPDGTVLTEVVARSFARTAAGSVAADTATPEDRAAARYTVGDNACFAPKLSVSLPAEVQTSDPAQVSVSLVTSDNRPAAGQTVTARVGTGRAVAAKTDSRGMANLTVPVSVAAGTRELLVRSAGSAGEGELRTTLRVLVERTLLGVRLTGSGATRAATATLTDDDARRRPLSGQRVVFAFGGRTVAASTDRAGRAVVQVPAGSSVSVSYAGRSGFLSAAKARTS